jgi:hypothetical protein
MQFHQLGHLNCECLDHIRAIKLECLWWILVQEFTPVAQVSLNMVRHWFRSKNRSTVSEMEELKCNTQPTVEFNRPVIGIAQAIYPFNVRSTAEPARGNVAIDIELKHDEPRTVFAADERFDIEALHVWLNGITSKITRLRRVTWQSVDNAPPQLGCISSLCCCDMLRD